MLPYGHTQALFVRSAWEEARHFLERASREAIARPRRDLRALLADRASGGPLLPGEAR